MPVTPDLQPTEFEITMPCQAPDCKAVTTCAFKKVPQIPYKEIRKNMRASIKKAHEEGLHVKPE